eukprot:2682569-Amphidinium_carterae.1
MCVPFFVPCTSLSVSGLLVLSVSESRSAQEFNPAYFQYLLRGPLILMTENPLSDWLPIDVWGRVNKLSELEGCLALLT